MEVHTFFLYLLVILLVARIFAEIAVKFRTPSVIGELLAGIVLGPSLFGWIEPVHAVKLLAEIGVIMLLFKVGLESDIMQLVRTGWKSFVVAISGFVFPLLFGFSLGYWFFELSLIVSLFIGGTLTATSIGITMRVLGDLKRQQSKEGQIVLGAAVLDDVLGVILLAIIYDFSIKGEANYTDAGTLLIFIAVFFVIAPISAKILSLVIHWYEEVTEIPGLIPTTIVSLVLFFAWLAHQFGSPGLLGGFAAGLALSRRFYLPFHVSYHTDSTFLKHMEKEMNPIIYLFTPIFFVMVGLSLDLRAIEWTSPFIWTFSLSMFAVAVIGKMIGPFFINEDNRTRWAIGIAMAPRGEVGLVFAELGRVSGIFTNEIYAGMIIVIAFTTLLLPFLMKWFYARFGYGDD